MHLISTMQNDESRGLTRAGDRSQFRIDRLHNLLHVRCGFLGGLARDQCAQRADLLSQVSDGEVVQVRLLKQMSSMPTHAGNMEGQSP